jgi:hypothetical protein
MLDPMLQQLFDAGAQDHDTSRADDEAFLVATLARVARERRRLARLKFALGFAMALVLAIALAFALSSPARVRNAGELAGTIEAAAHALGTLLAMPPLWACAVVLLLAAHTLLRTLQGGWR